MAVTQMATTSGEYGKSDLRMTPDLMVAALSTPGLLVVEVASLIKPPSGTHPHSPMTSRDMLLDK